MGPMTRHHPHMPPHPHAHSLPHHPHHPLQGHAHPGLAHPTLLDGAAYPLVDGTGPDPLDMAVGLAESPTGMIKYESPLPLE